MHDIHADDTGDGGGSRAVGTTLLTASDQQTRYRHRWALYTAGAPGSRAANLRAVPEHRLRLSEADADTLGALYTLGRLYSLIAAADERLRCPAERGAPQTPMAVAEDVQRGIRAAQRVLEALPTLKIRRVAADRVRVLADHAPGLIVQLAELRRRLVKQARVMGEVAA